MQIKLQYTKLHDQILSVIVENTQFSLFDIGQAYQRLRSFDKLLSAIDQGTEQRRPLETVVNTMMENNK